MTVGAVRVKGESPKVLVERVNEERSGCALATVMVKELVVAVAVLESVTRTVSDDDPAALGVPEIAPVDELRESPAGKEPETRAKEFPPDPPLLTRESA